MHLVKHSIGMLEKHSTFIWSNSYHCFSNNVSLCRDKSKSVSWNSRCM